MIFSRSRNFIFVRTAKVASTSLEFALSLHCGESDIVTPIGADEELQRWRLGVRPRNFADPAMEERYCAIIASGDVARLRAAFATVHRHSRFWNHISAAEIRDRIGRTEWERAFKFSVVRHPYDFAVSLIYYNSARRGAERRRVSPLQAAASLLRATRNLDIISIDGKVAVDRVLRYETLASDLHSIAPVI